MRRRQRAAALLLSAALFPACGGYEGEGEGEGEREPVLETAEQALRPDSPGNNELYRFDATDVVESFASAGGSFRVHFTRQGPNAVLAADTDASGVPDFVEDVAAIYDEVLALYQGELGFRAPPDDATLAVDNGGDGRFDVYLVDFNGMGDGVFRTDGCLKDKPEVCAGYMVQENDYKGYGYPSTKIANRILGSHELFHAVQSSYDSSQDSVIREGTAVWATERFDPTLKDFEGFLDGYLNNTDRTLNEPIPGPVDPFSYGSAIFFRYLSEHFGDTLIRSMWERCEDGANGVANPYWYDDLDAMLKDEAGSSFVEAFTEFATWNLFTGERADPMRSYHAGSGYPSVEFNEVTAPYSDDKLRVFRASAQYYRMAPGDRAFMTAALVPPKDAPDEAAGLELLLAVQRGAALDPVLRVAGNKDGSELTQLMETTGADSFLVVVVNTTLEGQSRRPALCTGTAEEVTACRNAIVAPDMGTPDAGAPDAGAPSPPSNDDATGCTCELKRPAYSAGPAGLLAIPAILYALARRRRGRRAR